VVPLAHVDFTHAPVATGQILRVMWTFVSELKRRNVIRVGIAYLVSAWLVLQVTDVLVSILELSAWFGKSIILLVALGFPVTLVLAWIYELTPEGVKREHEVDRSQLQADRNGRKLDFAIIGVLAVAVAYFAINHDWNRVMRIGPASAPSIAVLPFANRSALEEDVFFVDGVHDDLLALMSKLGDIKVISRTSVEKFRGTHLSIPEVAAQLGVSTVLEGAVQRAGGQVHINVQLIDADTDEHLWAETYDRELTTQNIIAIQNDIARVIARALHKVLTPAEQSRVRMLPTSNFLAYEEFLRGSQKMVLREVPKIREAVIHFRKSIELDPGYAVAYVALADAYHLLTYYGDMSRAESLPLSEAAVTSALELDPDLGRAHAALGAVLQYKGQMIEAVAAYERAIELAPGYATAYHWLAEHWRNSLNDPNRALPLINKAMELDPLSPVINITVAETLENLGRGKEEALTQIERSIEMAPAYPSAYFVKSQILAYSFNQLDQALRIRDRGIELDPDSASAYIGHAQLFSELGDDAMAIENIEHSLTLGPDYVWSHFSAAEIYAVAGDPEQAVKHAQRALSVLSGLWVPLRILRDADIAGGAIPKAIARYERIFPDFADQQNYQAHGLNLGASIDFAYLLILTGETERAWQILRSCLEFLQGKSRLGFLGHGIEDARALVLLGKTDEALEKLEEAVASGWRANWRGALRLPSFDAIRNDRRFVTQEEILRADMAAQLQSYRSDKQGNQKS
jgi:TolB-like protein/Tfp pilus assembly protein PilF